MDQTRTSTQGPADGPIAETGPSSPQPTTPLARREWFWRRRRWLLWLGAGLLVLLAAAGIAVSVILHRAEPFVRAQIVQQLGRRFHARVELDSFHMSVIDGLRAEGRGLRIWPPGVESGQPLIRLAEFRFHAPLDYAPGKPIHISVVELIGLDVDLPPRTQLARDVGAAAGAENNGSPPSGGTAQISRMGAGPVQFRLDSVSCTGAHLTLETSKPGKLPLEFAIAHLKLTDLSAGGAMHFDAELTNPKPVGTIYSQGTFGPWVVDDPGESALAGDYRFEHANLSSFKGIAGTLRSTGHYEGTLRDLTVDGQTETPDFRLGIGGNPMNLHTRFHAKVDGTDGDTWLEPVEATLGGSHFTAQGKIVRVPAPGSGKDGKPLQAGGHDIALTVNVDRGRIEDFLRLASHAPTPMLTGELTLQASLDIPPATAPVDQRMKLNGNFKLDDARFSSTKIQGRIAELSERGQGHTKDKQNIGAAPVLSSMQGDFQMAGGVVTLPDLQYSVPGAQIQLKGTYGVVGGRLNFAGTAKMQATVSQMVGGWKGLLLKPADKFFERDGAGTVVPIVIEGTREDPQFAIDFGGMKKTSPQRPGGP